jgi:hypothetical protein
MAQQNQAISMLKWKHIAHHAILQERDFMQIPTSTLRNESMTAATYLPGLKGSETLVAESTRDEISESV